MWSLNLIRSQELMVLESSVSACGQDKCGERWWWWGGSGATTLGEKGHYTETLKQIAILQGMSPLFANTTMI